MLKKIALNDIYKYNLIDKNDKIIAGLSGGADSVSLVHFLYSIKDLFNIKIFAVHVNHGIRADAIKDENFVKDFCHFLNIPLEIVKYDVKNQAKALSLTLEEAGRHFRYKAFNDILIKNNANKIALAHNKNDNIETFLMRLFRGAGLKGLSSIPIKRDSIIRPFLNCERLLIEDYCIQNNLKYQTDATNFEDIFTRNKIRLNTIPHIEQNFNKNFIQTIHNTISNITEENLFLEDMAKDFFKKCLKEKEEKYLAIDIKMFNSYNIVIKKRVLRLLISHFNTNLNNISSSHINSLLDLTQKQSGKMVNLPYNIIAKVVNEDLYFLKNNTFKNDISFSYNLKLDNITFIKELNKYFLITKKVLDYSFFSTKVYTISFNYDKINNELILRTKKSGDIILLNGLHKKIKKLFINLKIPSFKRPYIPLLAEGNNIVLIPYFFVSDNYKISTNTKNILYLHIWEEA